MGNVVEIFQMLAMGGGSIRTPNKKALAIKIVIFGCPRY